MFFYLVVAFTFATLALRSDAFDPVSDDAVTRAKFFPLAAAAYSDDPAQCVKSTFGSNATIVRNLVLNCTEGIGDTCADLANRGFKRQWEEMNVMFQPNGDMPDGGRQQGSECFLCEKTTGCPFGAIQGLNADSCYIISQEEQNFLQADADCKSQGGNLASVSSAFENNDIRKLLAGTGADEFWLGGHAADPGQWQWTDGKNFTYTNWNAGQPQAQRDQGLVVLSRTGRWFSVPYIAVTYYYVCEIPPLA